eukprot:CAMPEP_0183412794 /NCGR_PEP_ID=MMETSP0370-20130417/21255_1 /TAXON_ID=268820 /ORGANISM="Peridinium aciculiferum, Strain PAER-2" /LENGTH=45 /DNA_ID= /DNA_START= /DNA_END= /DNA_ORIENTATION=
MCTKLLAQARQVIVAELQPPDAGGNFRLQALALGVAPRQLLGQRG